MKEIGILREILKALKAKHLLASFQYAEEEDKYKNKIACLTWELEELKMQKGKKTDAQIKTKLNKEWGLEQTNAK